MNQGPAASSSGATAPTLLVVEDDAVAPADREEVLSWNRRRAREASVLAALTQAESARCPGLPAGAQTP